MNQGRQSRNESLPQSQRRRNHRNRLSIDSADQGAGGYLFGSLRESDNSGGSSFQNSGGSGTFLEYQQQQQQQIRHNDGVTNPKVASYAPKRNNRRQTQQQRLSGTHHRASSSSRRSSLTSSSHSRGTDQMNQSLSDIHRSSNPPEMSRQRRGHGGAYNNPTVRTRRQNRMQNIQAQSLIPTRRQNLQTQSLGITRLTKSLVPNKEEEEEDDDEFDTIPLVSSEYLKELNSRSATTKIIMSKDDSDANRLNPNNNSNSDAGTSLRGSQFSSLSQSVRVTAMRSSNGSNEMPHLRRASQESSDSRQNFAPNQSRPQHHQASIVRDSLRSSQSSQTRQARPSRGVRRQRRQQSNQISSSLNETQLRRNSRSVPGFSSPLFHSQMHPTGDGGVGVNYDISASLRHSNIDGIGYDNEIIATKQQTVVLNRNPPESMFTHAQHSTDVMNGSNSKGCGFTRNVNVAAENLNNKVSVPAVKRKKLRIFGVAGVCFIAVIVIVVVTVYITTSRSPDDDSKQRQKQTQKPLVGNDVELTSECENCISKPVSDIEGRCSSSNLPGSLSSCKNACSGAACCYSNFDGEKCYDDSNEASMIACGHYKPHCDVVYRPWSGATKGLIPAAPTSLFEGSDWDEICGSGASARKLSANNSSQTLTCLEFCLPSKCCFAPLVQSDLVNQGLFLNQDGAYQSIETDEYIMTSCTPKNYNSCLDYADACRDLITPLSFWKDEVVSDISAMSFSPSISMTPSTSTRRPTIQPTTERPTTQSPTKEAVEVASWPGQVDETTREPTPLPSAKDVTSVALTTPPTTLPPVAPTIVIPIPDLTKIRESCTGFQNYNLIAKGEFNARTKCHNACSGGLCCYDDLGLGIEKSCFSGNEDVCALYSDCLVLRAKPNNVLYEDSSSIGPPTPTEDITSLCSSKSIDTPVGISECFQACLPGSWCCGAIGESSCFDEFEESCSAYGQCLLMIDIYGGDSSQKLPPIPPNDLPYKCSYPALSAFHQSGGNVITECNRICDAGICCMGNTCGIGTTATEIEIADRCAAFEPCRHLLQLPTSPDDMETLCENKDSSQCLDACSVASCCWLSNDDGCFANFEQVCLSYAPYCSPNMNEIGDFPAPLSPPPSDLCVSGPPSACRNACRAGPSCCFAPSVVDNCFSQNEETCGMWAVCASFYQEDIEIV